MARDLTKKPLRKNLVQILLFFITMNKVSLKRNNLVANQILKNDYFTFS